MSEEDLLNRFEQARRDNDYGQMAQTVRFVRGLLQRDPTICHQLPLSDLISLFMMREPVEEKEWEELQDELYELLSTLLSHADVPSILCTYSTLIDATLVSNHSSAQMLVVEFVGRLLGQTWDELQQSLGESRIQHFVELIASPHIAVADRVATLIKENPHDQLLRRLEILSNKSFDAVIKVRVAAILAASQSTTETMQQRWGEVASMLDNPSDDLLVMTALQMIQEALQSGQSNTSLPPDNIIEAIFQVARLTTGEDYLKGRALSTLTELLKQTREIGLLNNAAEVLRDRYAAEHSNYLLGILLSLWSQLRLAGMDNLPPLPIEHWNSPNSDVRVAAMQAVNRIFQSPSTQLDALQHHLYGQLCSISSGGRLIDNLIDYTAKTLLEHVKEAGYSLLFSLLRYEWILMDALNQSQLVNFLLDRDQDRSVIGMHAKFGLVGLLLQSTQLSTTTRSRLMEYRSQGIAYSRAAPSLATESRDRC